MHTDNMHSWGLTSGGGRGSRRDPNKWNTVSRGYSGESAVSQLCSKFNMPLQLWARDRSPPTARSGGGKGTRRDEAGLQTWTKAKPADDGRGSCWDLNGNVEIIQSQSVLQQRREATTLIEEHIDVLFGSCNGVCNLSFWDYNFPPLLYNGNDLKNQQISIKCCQITWEITALTGKYIWFFVLPC